MVASSVNNGLSQFSFFISATAFSVPTRHGEHWPQLSSSKKRSKFRAASFTESLSDGENYFGVDKGKTGRFEAGGIFSAYYKTELLKNMFFENKLNLFQNYLEDPLNIDIDYMVSLEFTINRFLSTNILVHLLYDDNAAPQIQLKEVFGISFNVNF